MSIVAPIGATCLGIVMGWLVRYFIRRFESFNANAFGAIVGVVVGGVVVTFLEEDKSVWWFYPIGLFIGFVIYSVTVIWMTRWPRDTSKNNSINEIDITKLWPKDSPVAITKPDEDPLKDFKDTRV